MKDHCLAATRYWKERWKCCEIGYLNGIPLAGDELTKLIVSSYFTECQTTGFHSSFIVSLLIFTNETKYFRLCLFKRRKRDLLTQTSERKIHCFRQTCAEQTDEHTL